MAVHAAPTPELSCLRGVSLASGEWGVEVGSLCSSHPIKGYTNLENENSPRGLCECVLEHGKSLA